MRKLKLEVKKWYVGIDPGVQGGISALNGQGELHTMGFLPVRVGQRGRNVLDPVRLASFLRKYQGPGDMLLCCLEDTWGMGGDTAKSSFSMGHMQGSLVAVLLLQDISYEFVSPSVWKKSFNLLRAPKSGSIDRCREFYPDVCFSRKKDHNLGDSLLLARWCWERHRG